MDKDYGALNDKIAKWCGFKQYMTSLIYFPPNIEPKYPQDAINLPDFSHSLNAQSEWIYPELKKRKLRIEYFRDYSFIGTTEHCYHHWTILDNHSIEGTGSHPDSSAIAFALAVEKLIDSEVEDNG